MKLAPFFIMILFSLSTTVMGQTNFPYEVVRLNNDNPLVSEEHFEEEGASIYEGENINGPSLIRVPDWIDPVNRAHPTAQYYLYFGHHSDDYVRMAWASNIEGPYYLYQVGRGVEIGDRGVLDHGGQFIELDNNISIEDNHLSSPDVHVDDENQRIIMYFHAGSSTFVNGVELNSQLTYVSTSPYGLEFYDNIEPVILGTSYFRFFEYDGEMYAFDNGGNINKALDASNPWTPPANFDFTDRLWDRSGNNGFQDDILEFEGLESSVLRVRHTGVRVVGDELQVFYTRRGELNERVQMSTIDMSAAGWEEWNPSYSPAEIMTANPGWEGGQFELSNSETSSAPPGVNQLRDPYVFEDSDGQLYLLYTGEGEDGIGLARLYETPTPNLTVTPIMDAYVGGGTDNNTNYGTENSLEVKATGDADLSRKTYVMFDLTDVASLTHAVVRLHTNSTVSRPVTVYEADNTWDEASIVWNNAPAIGEPVTSTQLGTDTKYYEWNITQYAQSKVGDSVSLVFDIESLGDDNTILFDSKEGLNSPQLDLVTMPASAPETPTNLNALATATNQIQISWTDNSFNEDGFQVERKLGSEDFAEIADLEPNVSYYIDTTDLIVDTEYIYRVRGYNTTGNSNYSNEAAATTLETPPVTITKLYAVEDAYIRGGDNSAIAFGTDNPTVMEIKTGSNPNFFRDAFMKFDLSSYSDIADARLFIYGSGQRSIDITAYVNQDDWNESDVTWDSAPAIGSAIDKIDISTADQWYELDVTSAVQAESSGDGILTLRLQDTDVENRTVTILTKEYGIGEFHPYLLVEGNTDGSGDISVTGVEIESCPTTILSIGNTNQLNAVVLPSSASDKSVSWSSSDPTVATVDSNGIVSGVASGIVTITATSTDGGFTSSCDITVEPVNPIDIFVALGQSNMAGRAQMTSEVTEVVSNVRLMDDFGNWTDAKNPFNLYSNIRKTVEEQQVGPSYSFARAMTKHTGKTIGMVVNAKGGTAISAFNVGGEFHDQIISRIKDLNILGTVKGIIWHQGESDSNRTGVYMGRLVELVGALREELGDVRFVAGQLGNWTVAGESSPKYGDFNELISTIESNVTNSTYVVNDDLTDFDESHFDLPSQILLGYRYAQEMLSSQYDIDISIIKVIYDGDEDLSVNDETLVADNIRSYTELKDEQAELIFEVPEGMELFVEGAETPEDIGQNKYRVLLTPVLDEVTLNVSVGALSARWLGSTDHDWSNGANWNLGLIPDETHNVIIENTGTNPIITDESYTVNNLEIEDGAVLTINQNASLTVAEDLTANSGYVDVTFGASLLLKGSVTGSNHRFTRETTFSSVSGKYSVIGSPITSGNTNDLGNLVYQYDENEPYGSDGSGRFIPVVDMAMSPGDAYFSASTGTITFTGMPNTGTIMQSLVYNVTDGANAGFNLVSNPYTSAIGFDAFMSENNAALESETIYIWDDGGSNSGQRSNSDYIIINNIGATRVSADGRENGWDEGIRAMQGFFVKAKQQGQLTFTPEMLITNKNDGSAFYREDASSSNTLRLALSSNDFYSDCLIGLRDDARLGIDETYDAPAMQANSALKIYTMLDGKPFAIQGLPSDLNETILDLSIESHSGGEHVLSIGETLLDRYEVHLLDNLLNRSVDLSVSEYKFIYEPEQMSTRFQLIITRADLLASADSNLAGHKLFVSNELLNIQMSDEVKTAELYIYDIGGKAIRMPQTLTLINGRAEVDFHRKGLFIVRVVSPDQIITRKVIAN